MSCSSWRERSGGRGWPGGVAVTIRAASPKERAVSERSDTSEPTLTTACGSKSLASQLSCSATGRQAGRRAGQEDAESAGVQLADQCLRPCPARPEFMGKAVLQYRPLVRRTEVHEDREETAVLGG
nr:hypothetical protein [uncultured bacterium]